MDQLFQSFLNSKTERAFLMKCCDKFCNGQRHSPVERKLLGNITDPGFSVPGTGGGESDHAVIFPLSQNGFQQGTLTGTIGADQRHHFAAMDM